MRRSKMASLARHEESLQRLNLTKTASDDDIFTQYIKLALHCLPKHCFGGQLEIGDKPNIKEFLLLTLAYCTLLQGSDCEEAEFENSDFKHLKKLFAHLIGLDGICTSYTMSEIYDIFLESITDPLLTSLYKGSYSNTSYTNPDRIPRSDVVGSKKQMQKKWRKENYAMQERHPDPKPTERKKTTSTAQQATKEIVVKAREKVKETKEKPPEIPKPTKEEIKAQKQQICKEVEESLAKHKEQKKKELEKEEKRRAKEEEKRREMESQSLAPAALAKTTSGKASKKKKKKAFMPSTPVKIEPPKNWKQPKIAKPTVTKSVPQPQAKVQKKQKATVTKKQPAKMESMNFNLFDEHGVIDDWGDVQVASRPGPAFSQTKGAPPVSAPYALQKKHDVDDGFMTVKGKNSKPSFHSNNTSKPPQTNVWEQRRLEQNHLVPKSLEEEEEILAAVLEMSKCDTMHEQSRSPARPPKQDSFPAASRADLFGDDLLFGSPASTGQEDFLPTKPMQNKSGGTLNALSQEWSSPLEAVDTPIKSNPAPQLGLLNALDQRLNPNAATSERLTMSSAASASPLHSLSSSFVTSDFSSEEEEEEEVVTQSRPPIDQLFGTMKVENANVDDDDDWELEDDIDEELDKVAQEKQRKTYVPLMPSQPVSQEEQRTTYVPPMPSQPVGLEKQRTTYVPPVAPQNHFDPLHGALASMGFGSDFSPAPARPVQPAMPHNFSAFPQSFTTAPPPTGTTYYAPSFAHLDPRPTPRPQYDVTPAYDPFSFDSFAATSDSKTTRKPPGLQLLDEEVNATVNAIRGSGGRSSFQI